MNNEATAFLRCVILVLIVAASLTFLAGQWSAFLLCAAIAFGLLVVSRALHS
jgi:hypothetical protein